MKPTLLTFFLLIAGAAVLAAQTNTFPSSGNVGIGTTSPAALLDVRGTAIFDSSSGGSHQYLYLKASSGYEAGLLFYDGAAPKFELYKTSGNDFSLYNYNLSATAITVKGDTNNIGIGTTGPRSRLDLGGSLGAGKGVRLGDYLEINEREHINNALTFGWNAYIAADDGTFAPTYAPGSAMVLTMAGGGWGELDFYGRNWGGNSTPQNLDSFTHVMRLGTNGNVGIGTVNPTTSLDVNGSLLVTGGAAAAGTFSVKAIGAAGADRDIFLAGAAGFSNGFTVQRISNEMRYVFNHGNVGIGTTTPGTYKLAVLGKIRANEVVVDTGWADYVFADDYRLAPLSEVEQHIREKKHLPGIPSASEVGAGGVSLGDMQAKLLAKVEEVTLHLIRLEKENAAQFSRLENLEQENRELRRQLSSVTRNP